MKGDVVLTGEIHYQVAKQLAPSLLNEIRNANRKFIISVAGESGSGKSETTEAIFEVLHNAGIVTLILQQDDYFIFPPKANDAKRRRDSSWVGPHEVKIDLLNSHLTKFRKGAETITKPLVDHTLNVITTEKIDIFDKKVAIVEGTYTSLLDNIDYRIFIARTYIETRTHRENRRRNAFELDRFTEQVLKIEHKIISSHSVKADVTINSDYSVTVNKKV